MSRFTKEQLAAINIRNTNVLVSAGAGSGKTTVLSSRVISLLKEGYSLNRLLILTFTDSAAKNMKIKIKQLLQVEDGLESQLRLVDGADIETFDSFYQKIVRKYRVCLNLDEDFQLVNEATFNILKRQFLHERFEKLFAIKEKVFLEIMDSYTAKNSDPILDLILKTESNLDLVSDPTSYVYEFLTSQTPVAVDDSYDYLFKYYHSRLQFFYQSCDSLQLDGKFMAALSSKFAPVLNSTDLFSLKSALLDISKLPSLSACEDKERYEVLKKQYYKVARDGVLSLIEEDEFKLIYANQKRYISFLYGLVVELRNYINEYKAKYNVFSFSDIAQKVLYLFQTNQEALQEEREYYQEIMVDEYQDNSDVQEAIINMLSRKNLFLVGDIKQSIYRFRNANPSLFLKRYKAYKENPDLGTVIDMNDNFRSTPAVISDINELFTKAMSLDFGGADYVKEHIIKASNPSLLDYRLPNRFIGIKIEGMSAKEIAIKEIKAVAKDIVYRAKHEGIPYSDFALLLDRKTRFDDIVEAFTDEGIPVALRVNNDLSSFTFTSLLVNILKIMMGFKKRKFNARFLHAFYSLSRSIFFEMKDEEIYSFLEEKKVTTCPWIVQCAQLYKEYEDRPVEELFTAFITEFDILVKLTRDEDYLLNLKLLEAFMSNIRELMMLSFDLEATLSFFEGLKSDGISYLTEFDSQIKGAVTLTNIHKAKGLEYPHCYFLNLSTKYNEKETKSPLKTNNKYGIILPITECDFKSEGVDADSYLNPFGCQMILEEKEASRQEELRLLYVALTRAKLSMTFVAPLGERVDMMWSEAKCFDDIFSISGFYQHLLQVDVDTLDIAKLSNEMHSFKPIDYGFTYQELNIKPIKRENYHRSSKISVHASQSLLRRGEKLHQILEVIDFKNPDYSFIKKEEDVRLVKNFLTHEIFKEIKDALIYKEFEYVDELAGNKGIIDLLLIYEDRVQIIDYKLKKLDDPDYLQQLASYKAYIETKTDLMVETFLYSIIDGRMEKKEIDTKKPLHQ